MKVSDLMADRREICSGNLERIPKVSIVTPTYKRNQEGLLAPCIESALAQSFSDIELIVIDDGSSDGTEDTVRAFAARDNRVRYFRHERNSALPAVRTNEGILLARGESVAFLFDDNVLEREFISRAQAELQASGVDVVHANVHMLGPGGSDFTLGNWPLCKELLGNLNTIPNGGVLCRRSFFDRYGLYDPHLLLRRICDWDLWLRAKILGASFRHLDIVAATEHGLVSKNSIGNTVKWDVKVAYGYMFDTQRYGERAARLHPNSIGSVDVLDTQVVLPYVCSRQEWAEVISNVYEPFAAVNRRAANYPTILTNRAEIDNFGYGRNDGRQKRRRFVIVSNTFNSVVESWAKALSEDGNVCLHVPEWQLSAIPADVVDLLVLIDCCASFLIPVIEGFRKAHVPTLYVVVHGSDHSQEEAADLAKLTPIRTILGEGRYFPQPGIPFTPDQERCADVLRSICSAIVDSPNEDLKHKWYIEWAPKRDASWLRDVANIVKLFDRRRNSDASARPRALIALNSELLSGSEAYGLMLGQVLQSLGMEVQVWTPDTPVYGLQDGALAARLAQLGLPAARGAPYEPGGRFLELAADLQAQQVSALRAALSSLAPDLIVCAGFMPVFARARATDAVLVGALFQPSAYDPNHLRTISDELDGWMSDCQWSHAILKELLVSPSAVVRSIVTQACTTEAAAQTPIAVSPREVRIALGGTLQPRKGQVYALQALKLLADSGVDVRMNIYGYTVPALKWYRDKLDTAISQLALDDRVSIRGFRDLDEIASENDIILSSSLDESLPQTIAECMARGLVPVAVRSGGLDELVIDGVSGFLAEDPSPEKVFLALARAVARREDWPSLRAASADALLEYTVESARSRLVGLLEAACKRANSSPPAKSRAVFGSIKDDRWSARVAKLESTKEALRLTNRDIGVPEVAP
ncbi:glycosyltransferase [Bradyrhizobium sp. SZCCHNRI3037]|uniref:glycosyltransferase n=1 Tax=Bradyrhizobium sp. SZCCHNRI3037 TaxID=3057290 RepID=UPI002916BF50|nr:glycosyltransferase [Bradyrhizobium sp. SZCCHNRI3037]